MYNNFPFLFISNDITFYATNCKTATYNFAFKKIEKLGLEKPISLSLE